MDKEMFTAPGTCPACGMTLELVSTQAGDQLPFEPKTLSPGAGVFRAAGGRGHEARRLTVHYYKPRGFNPAAPILLVIPGSGRSAGASRDYWIRTAESHNVLIAALGYPERDYDFAAYQMGGVIHNLNIRNARLEPNGEEPASLHLRDEDITFEFNDRRDEWLFSDFDRIFGLLAAAVNSSRRTYDVFGHSAGAQILHRLALFQPQSSADRIVAANAGFYTLPLLDVPLPFGLQGTGATNASLAASFECRLIVLLGGNDNDPEQGGQHLHTPLADRQGLDRLSRGRYFFDAGRRQAEKLGGRFSWKMEVIPGVGHDAKAMSEAAAFYLFS